MLSRVLLVLYCIVAGWLLRLVLCCFVVVVLDFVVL